MECVVVLQARQSSTRLPNKVLLKIRGVPVVVLAAKRVMREKMPLVVAIPDNSQNHDLKQTLEHYGVPFFAGDECDVLGRVLGSIEHVPDDTVVVRLTADNVFPDSDFVKNMIQEFRSSHAEYLGVDYQFAHLPYGLGAEVFTAGTIREAGRKATNAFDREHVTPWIKRNKSVKYFDLPTIKSDAKCYRATIDTPADFALVSASFARVQNPESASIEELSGNLIISAQEFGILPGRVINNRWLSNTALGTVQMGLSYGIANHVGIPAIDDCRTMISSAINKGLCIIDTAQAYGESEERVGVALAGRVDRPLIVTKLLPDIRAKIGAVNHEEYTEYIFKLVKESQSKLGGRIDCLMFHRWQDRKNDDGLLGKVFLHIKDLGLIGGIGASVLSPDEFNEAIAAPDVEFIQFPYNILDHRWESVLQEAHGHSKILIARSVFLQGLLTKSSEDWPDWVVNSNLICDKLDSLVNDFQLGSRLDLCLAYVRASSSICTVVVGAESPVQVDEILRLQSRPPLVVSQVRKCQEAFFGLASERLLDPWRWNESD